MKNQTYRMTLLYDFYGDLLTDRQKEFYDLYYNEDLSLAEIAENYSITRQGVRDVIMRAEAILTATEEKTGIIRRFHKMQEHIQTVQDSLDKVMALNQDKYQDDALEALCLQMQGAVELLKKE
jgi:predicted DNA-binding protein YlxM (UPF0122 family)